jgi:hypothetical protein
MTAPQNKIPAGFWKEVREILQKIREKMEFDSIDQQTAREIRT